MANEMGEKQMTPLVCIPVPEDIRFSLFRDTVELSDINAFRGVTGILEHTDPTGEWSTIKFPFGLVVIETCLTARVDAASAADFE